MPDPFKEPNVTLEIILEGGSSRRYVVTQTAGFEIMRECQERNRGPGIFNGVGLVHNEGWAWFDLSEVAGVSIQCRPDAARQFMSDHRMV